MDFCKLLIAFCLVYDVNWASGDTGPATGSLRWSATMQEIVGEQSARTVAAVIPGDESLSWELYIPDRYDAADPPGLMVYISPTSSGKIPRGWKSVMEDKNLIWVAADRSGNAELVGRRAILAIIAPTMVGQNYEFDRERVYVTGLSGGGKMASMVATDHAHLFKGAIYNCGVNFWDGEPERMDLVKQNHFVFVTGTLDQALEPTKKVYRRYRQAGADNSLLMIIRDMTHRNPGRFKFAEAVDYLDSRL